jgi:hypothetical protein
LNAVVDETLTAHPLADSGALEQIDAALLQNARPHTVLHVLARACLDDDGADALQAKQMRQHQPGRTGPDDANLGR